MNQYQHCRLDEEKGYQEHHLSTSLLYNMSIQTFNLTIDKIKNLKNECISLKFC